MPERQHSNSNSPEVLARQFDLECQQLELQFSEADYKRYFHYLKLLQKWSKTYNLTRILSTRQILTHHIMDCLAVVPKLSGHRFIDLGSGAGLPGLILAIDQPNWQITLLDSSRNHCHFLQQVITELSLLNVQLVNSRVEKYIDNKGFDGVISRAFKPLPAMLNLCAHLPHSKGYIYAMKGKYPRQELATIEPRFHLVDAYKLEVPHLKAERHLLKFSII